MFEKEKKLLKEKLPEFDCLDHKFLIGKLNVYGFALSTF